MYMQRQNMRGPGEADFLKSLDKDAKSTAKRVKARLGRKDMRSTLAKITSGDLKGALGLLNAAVLKKPDDAVALALRHYTRHLLGHEKGSMSDFAKVNKISPMTNLFILMPMAGDAQTPLMRAAGFVPGKK